MPTRLARRCALPVVAAVSLSLAVPVDTAIAVRPSSGTRHARHAAAQHYRSTIIPKPVHQTLGGKHFTVRRSTHITVIGRAGAIAHDLAHDLRPATGYRLPVESRAPRTGDIVLQLNRTAKVRGDRFGEGYQLRVGKTGVALRAATAHGLFNGVQTLLQLLPPRIASRHHQAGPWTMHATRITDYPRFRYRGFMLDIARHYEPPSVAKRFIREAAEYKFNVFHLHLSDDQGFRLKIAGFPRLTRIGARGSVGTQGRRRDPGGFWTQRQYRSVVQYAKRHFVTVIPEVDTPGHTNAIIMSEYNDTKNPRLNAHPHNINCSTNHPPKWNYTGDVGYSALCPGSHNTKAILRAIITQLTRLSPGRYYDVGGDEVPTNVLSQRKYAELINYEAHVIRARDKMLMGWADVSGKGTKLPRGSIAEYWNPASGKADGTQSGRQAVAKHMQIVMAPANHAYLDQRYATHVPKNLGQTWACPHGCDVNKFYNWNPTHYVTGVGRRSVLGVEGALWTETIRNRRQAEYMVFPRLLALAEVAWSPSVRRTGTSPAYHNFLHRLAAQGPRLQKAGINFYRSPKVAWPSSVHRNQTGTDK